MKIHRLAMSMIAALIVLVALMPTKVKAQQLPSMNKAPWIGFFSGYQRRGFEFGVNNEGECELYLIKRKKKDRAAQTRTVKIFTEVLMVTDEGKSLTKRMQDQGLSTKDKEGTNHEKVSFTALSTGNAKVEVHVKYERNSIILDGRILDRGELEKGKLFLVFKVVMPSMYSSGSAKDQKKMKARMRKDRLKLARVKDMKSVSLKSYLMVDFQDDKVAKGGVTSLESKMDGQEGKDFIFTTVSGTGTLQIENRYKNKKAMPWKGYLVKWMREMGDEKQSPFVIKVK